MCRSVGGLRAHHGGQVPHRASHPLPLQLRPVLYTHGLASRYSQSTRKGEVCLNADCDCDVKLMR